MAVQAGREGASDMERQTGSPSPTARPILWYVKWMLAFYMAASGIFLLAFIVSLPFVGPALADAVLEHGFLFALVVLAAAPFIFRLIK